MEGCRGGPINPSAPVTFDGEQLGVKCVEPSTSSYFFTETLGLDDRIPFLQMLKTLYPSNIHSPLKKNPTKPQNQFLEIDSCVTHDVPELHCPVISDAKNPTQVSLDGTVEERREPKPVNECRNDLSSVRTHQSKLFLNCGKMRKPKCTKAVVENKKDAEMQRMTHIAVERNRRRQMSDYLSVLHSLLPPSYAAKGDQASIVGGVIDYVKKLEQHLQSLQTKRKMYEVRMGSNSMPMTSETSNVVSASTSSSPASLEEDCNKKSQLGDKADVNIRVVQTHIYLHIECDNMKQNQLIKFLVALEELGLTIMHLNITSIQNSSSYSLNLKVEDECNVRSAEEISSSVERVLNSLNIYNGTRSSVRNQNQDDVRNVRDE